VFAGGILVFASCKKDRLPAVDPQPTGTKGVYVLCEGAYSSVAGTNNSSITYFDLSGSVPDKDFFKKQNGIDLGTNASDLQQYGSKMYCVITGTTPANKDSYVEVISISTGKSLKRIPFSDASRSFQARYVTFYKNKAYVSGYDGYITRIDTASMNIESRIKVGGAMEQMAVVNGKLYVTNSAHYLYATENNASVSVVDLTSFSKLKDITVNFNPTKIAAMPNGELFVVTKGNYGNIPAAVDRINSVTDTKTQSSAINLYALNISGGKAYGILEGSWPAPNTLKIFNTATGALGNDFVTDQTAIANPYGVTVNGLDNKVFVGDDNGVSGQMFCFSSEGKKLFSFATSSYPQSAVFNYSFK